MFDPFTIMALGALTGGIANKKNPLKGAILGGGMGAAGMALPGVLPTPYGPDEYLRTGASEGSTLGNVFTGSGGASGAVGQGSAASLFQGLPGYMKTAGDVAGAASQVQGLFQQPQQAQPMMQAPQAQGDPIAQLLAQRAQLDEARRRQFMGYRYGSV